MSDSAATLITRVRRFMGDYPALDVTTASAASNGTAITVADTSKWGYHANGCLLEIGNEILQTTSLASSTSLTVRRGWLGTTAASIASGATILVNPRFTALDILEALNAGLDAAFPKLYQNVVDESLETAEDTREYTVPTVSSTIGMPIPYIHEVRLLESGDSIWRVTRHWRIIRGTTPKLHFDYLPVSGATIRIRGVQPIPHLSLSSSLPDIVPYNASTALVYYAAQYLLAQSENRRLAVDRGALDDREQANKVGSSMAASSAQFQRFSAMLDAAAMPPVPKHMIPTR